MKKILVNYSTPQSNYVLPVLPGGNVFLMFTGSETSQMVFRQYVLGTRPCFGVGGQIFRENIQVFCSGYVEFIFVELHPIALYHLYKSPVQVFTDQFTPIDDPRENRQKEIILNSSDLSQKVGLLTRFLERHLPIHQILQDPLFQLTQWIERQAGQIRVEEMSYHMGMSKRKLQRSFLEKMGVSPKYYAKMVQMRQVANLVMANKSKLLTDVMYENGHYDAAHFFKDFKRFFQMNPKRFTEQGSPLAKQILQ